MRTLPNRQQIPHETIHQLLSCQTEKKVITKSITPPRSTIRAEHYCPAGLGGRTRAKPTRSQELDREAARLTYHPAVPQPGLRFKQVHADPLIYSVRVGMCYRAVGVRDGDTMIWYWIGSHADYDRLLEDSRCSRVRTASPSRAVPSRPAMFAHR